MYKLLLLLTLLLFPIAHNPAKATDPQPNAPLSECRELYMDMGLDGIVSYKAFVQGIIGYNKISTNGSGIMTLIDFTKPSTAKRLYVLNVIERKMLFHTYVSHGQKSGENFATSFSNISGSHQSSLGFFVTGLTYQGKNGYSLLLDGLEAGINDKARERSIVIHGAPYCDPTKIAHNGRLGRSFGCPALPQTLSEPIINTIKNGTLLYIYADDVNYFTESPILRSTSQSSHYINAISELLPSSK